MAREPRVAPGRHVANVACLIHLENAQCGARNVTSVAIKIISVHVVGPNSQETGTGDPGAGPKATKSRVYHLIQGLEANPWPRVPTAESQIPFKTIWMTPMEMTQRTSMEKVQTLLEDSRKTFMEPTPFKTIRKVLILSRKPLLPFTGQNLWPAYAMIQTQRAKPRSSWYCRSSCHTEMA